MKTVFKSILYFSFAGLILTGCAKNDDFSVPPMNCTEPNVSANQTIEGLYSSLVEDSKVVAPYTKDETISGIVISSDQAGNFYQQLIVVDENTQLPITLKADIKGGFALYPVGSKVYIKLKDTYIHYSYGMITIGGGIYTSASGNKYADVLVGSKIKSTLFRSCSVLTGDAFDKYINVVTLEELKADKSWIGKLIRVNDIQFDRAVVGKTYYAKQDPSNDGQGQTLRKMVDKKGNSLVVRTSQYASGIKDQIIPKESGTITGIVSEFQGTLQFYPRTMEDMNLKNDAFEVDGGGKPEIPDGEKEGEGPAGVNQNTPSIIANFSNWPSFILATNKYGVLANAKEAAGQGKESGKGAMSIKDAPDANSYAFTVENQKVVAGAKSISMWVKGTSDKSLSFNVYKADGTYDVFNLATDKQIEDKDRPVYSQDLNLIPTKRMNSNNSKNGNNDYVTGSINAGNWIKITLDLTGVEYNTTGSGEVFALKVGSALKGKKNYDLLISDIVFDGGEDNGSGGEGENGGEGEFSVFGKKGSFSELVEVSKKGGLTVNQEGTAIKVEGLSSDNTAGFSLKDVTVPANAKNIIFFIKGKSTSATARGSFVVNTIEEGKTTIWANYSIKEGLYKPSTEVITVSGINDRNNQYDGTIDTEGKWIKVILPLEEINHNVSGVGSFIQFRFAKGGEFQNILIDKVSFE